MTAAFHPRWIVETEEFDVSQNERFLSATWKLRRRGPCAGSVSEARPHGNETSDSIHPKQHRRLRFLFLFSSFTVPLQHLPPYIVLVDTMSSVHGQYRRRLAGATQVHHCRLLRRRYHGSANRPPGGSLINHSSRPCAIHPPTETIRAVFCVLYPVSCLSLSRFSPSQPRRRYICAVLCCASRHRRITLHRHTPGLRRRPFIFMHPSFVTRSLRNPIPPSSAVNMNICRQFV